MLFSTFRGCWFSLLSQYRHEAAGRYPNVSVDDGVVLRKLRVIEKLNWRCSLRVLSSVSQPTVYRNLAAPKVLVSRCSSPATFPGSRTLHPQSLSPSLPLLSVGWCLYQCRLSCSLIIFSIISFLCIPQIHPLAWWRMHFSVYFLELCSSNTNGK